MNLRMTIHRNDIVIFFAMTVLIWASGNRIVSAQVPESCQQLIVTTASSWDTHRANLQCWERTNSRSRWTLVKELSWPVLLGRNGMAWGRGPFIPSNDSIPWKIEKDGKAPAGIFTIGKLYGYASRPPSGAAWPYHQVGEWDAWLDDPKLPLYNQHVRVDPANVPPWFKSQRMRLGDNAYRWLLEIQHNTFPIKPGFGSAIFFHVRRGPDKPTAGCTTMTLENLEKMIAWLKHDKSPAYVLLPESEYHRVRESWGLP